MDLLAGVGGCELGGEVGEVGEGEFARVRGVGYGEEADEVADEVAGWMVLANDARVGEALLERNVGSFGTY